MQLPDHDTTMALVEKAQQGDILAQEQLVINNAALVKSVIKKFLNRGADYDDLFQIGCIGLIKAIKNYDKSFSVRFSTYAVPMIMGEIKRFLRDDGMIKVSRTLKELAVKVVRKQEELSIRFGRDATIGEIAGELEVEPSEAVMAIESVRPHMSIYEPIYGEDSESKVLDKIDTGKVEDNGVVDRILLKELLRRLDKRERQIIILRYFQDKTQAEIAKLLGVSQVQISRLEGRIIEKMRKAAE